MDKNSVITLEDGTNYELLEKISYQDINYFLAEKLLAEDKETGEYAILKEIKENNETYVEKEENEDILLTIIKILTTNFTNVINSLKPEELL